MHTVFIFLRGTSQDSPTTPTLYLELLQCKVKVGWCLRFMARDVDLSILQVLIGFKFQLARQGYCPLNTHFPLVVFFVSTELETNPLSLFVHVIQACHLPF